MNTQRNTAPDRNCLKLALCLVLPLFEAGAVAGQTVPRLGGDIERVFTTDSEPGWLEGPAYDGVGGVWFGDVAMAFAPPDIPTTIFRYDVEDNETVVKIENTMGVAGLAFDADRNLIMTHSIGRNVTRRAVDANGDFVGDVTVLADHWQGQAFRYPNDLVVDGNGGVYFTDPDPAPTFNPADNGVYYISPTGELQQVSTGLAYNNGIGLAPDGETLYVVESGLGVKLATLWAFDVNHDGSLANQRVFAELPPSDGRLFLPDGMTVDRFGNVYSSDLALEVGAQMLEPGLPGSKVRVWNSAGEEILTFEPPEGAINLTFAPPDGNMLYFTSEKSLWRVPITFVPEPSGLLLLSIAVGSFGLIASRRGGPRS